LGIPAEEDRVVQVACRRIPAAILEVDLLDTCYGFDRTADAMTPWTSYHGL
jgi:hypothetical protein